MPFSRILPRRLACACLALLASSALADGKAFTLPEKAKVEMADQQALIAFDGKQETLVIDTRIKPVDAAAGASSGKQSYAWVVPLPAVPTKVEAGTVGMFDTLRELTRPELVNRTKISTLAWVGLYLALVVAAFIVWPKRMAVAVGLALGAAVFLILSSEHVNRYYDHDGQLINDHIVRNRIAFGVMTTVFLLLMGLAIWRKRMPLSLGALGMIAGLFLGLFAVVTVPGQHSYLDPGYFKAFLICGLALFGLLVFIFRWWREVIIAVGLIAPGVLVPVLGVAQKNASMGGAITLYQNETIGSYDTAVLASKDGAALSEWLGKNGYPLSADTAPVVAQLAKEGWCFVAMKLHESPTGFAHPHPMGFVFPASKAIYPMRLTGVGQVAPLTVDLFVCGEQQAQVQGFHAGCAVGTKEMDRGGSAYDTGYWVRGADPVPVAHPGLRHFAANAQALTWLRGVVPANEMGHDIEIGWHPLVPHRDAFYSDKVAGEFGLSAALVLLGATSIAVATLVRLKRKRAAWIAVAMGVGLAGMAWVVAYAATPKMAAEKSEFGGTHAWLGAMRVSDMVYSIPKRLEGLSVTDPISEQRLRAEITKGLDEEWNQYSSRQGFWRNYFHEGDSPNQFSIREENGSAKVYFYNGVGQEFQIWPEAEKK